MKSLTAWGLLLIALIVAAPSVVMAAAPAQRVLVVLSDDEAAYHETFDAFRETLLRNAGPALPLEIEHIMLRPGGEPAGTEVNSPPDIVIPIGAQASEFARDHYPGTPVYNILITRSAYDAIWRRALGARRVSALYLEQPFDRQFRLIRLSLPDLKQASVLLGRQFRGLEGEVRAAARRSDITLHIVDYAAARNPVDAFNEALDHGEVTLVFPDAEVITPNRAKWLLYMAYQKQVPIVGFSRALADAGALAALYTAPDQIGREAAERVIDIALDAISRPGQAWRLPPPAWPKYFNIALNRAVARAFNIETRDHQRLAQSLRAAEQADTWQAEHLRLPETGPAQNDQRPGLP